MLDLITGFLPLGELIPWAVGAVGALVALFFARQSGKHKERAKNMERDVQNAREIEDRVDEALRHNDGDTRPVDDRLRERGRIRD